MRLANRLFTHCSRLTACSSQCTERTGCSLRQADSLWLSILADKQIHLDPLARALFVHGQSQRAQSTTLQTHAHDGGIPSFLRHAAGEQGEIFRVVRCHQRFVARGLAPGVVRHAADNLVAGRCRQYSDSPPKYLSRDC